MNKIAGLLGRSYRRWHFALLVAVLLTSVSYWVYRTPMYQVLERKVEDIHFKMNDAIPDSSIILIAIDDNSLDFTRQSHLPWPWPRDIWQPVLELFEDAGARNIMFDLQFTDPDFDRAETYADETDGIFADAIRAKGDVILGVQLVPEETTIPGDVTRFCQDPTDVVAEYRYRGMLDPIPVLREAAFRLGVINVEPDEDGIIRRIPLYYQVNDVVLPQLALAPVCDADGDVHAERNGKYRLFWYGSGGVDGAFGKQYISMCHVLAIARRHMIHAGREVDSETQALMNRLRGKYIIIGTTAGGLFDLKPTPTDRIFPGMEIWATALSNYLQKDFVYVLPVWLHLLLLVAIAFGVYFSFASLEQRVVMPLVISIVAIVLFSVASWRLWNLFLPVVSILNTFLISYIIIATMHYLLEGKAKRQIRTVFGRYLSEEVVKELMRDPEKVEMGGEEIEATVFFSDIANFTTISEDCAPKQLVSLLNEYFDHFIEILMKQKCMLDKYTGDGLMALFGVPLYRKDHAIAACKVALEHKRFSKKLVEDIGIDATRDLHLNTRIGINSGRIIAGNIGSVKRMDYTAIGDDVNLAARLEGVNKLYHTSIMISGSTYELVKDHIRCRELDTIRVKGKDKPTKIYEVLSMIDEDYDDRLLDRYAEALKLYRDKAWREAGEIFRELSEAPFEDGASMEMLKRCENLIERPPAEWDEVHTLEVK